MQTLLRIPLYLQTVLALLLGALVGILLGERAAPLGLVSKWIVEVIKIIAVPILFLAITEAVYAAQIRGKGILAMLLVCTVNGVFAITIALTITNIFRPGELLPLKGAFPTHGISHTLLTTKVEEAFSSNPKASIFSGTSLAIALALVLSGILRLLPRYSAVEKGLKQSLELLFKLLSFVAHFIPIAVFCAIAKVIGSHGHSYVKGLLAYLFLCLLGMVLHVGLVYQYWISIYSNISLKKFWKEAKEPVIHSFGINSSLATLPLTLRALKNLKVSDGSARLGACIGTNLNNDGILLYEVFATLFLAQAYGVHLEIFHQVLVGLLCIIATIGVAGVPEAGMISLSLIVSAVGLPIESLPILMTVDWVLARVRSMVNVTGDLTVSIAIDRLTSR